jgi:imidazolonepropionase
MIEADLAVVGAAELVTAAGPAPRTGPALSDPGEIEGGCLAALDGDIVFVGTEREYRREVSLRPEGVAIDAGGRTVLPGFVDPHTHLPFAGWREQELLRRLRGDTYESIAAQGGGILSTVAATRRAPIDTLVTLARGRLDGMLLHGTTTVEAKSGYGLDLENELKQLEALRRVAAEHVVEVVSTFLGAHVVPAERRSDRDGYVREVVDGMIPAVARGRLARYCDVFVEEGAFTVAEGEAILRAARAAGLEIRVHADQRRPGGGALLAARLAAASADHLDHVDAEGIAALRASGTTAVLLPGASFFLGESREAPARRLVESGVPVALATDYNPGTCPTGAMTAILPLACLRMGLLPGEAIVAATLNAAHSLGLSGRIGSLEVGKAADLQVLGVPNHLHLAYQFGVNHCQVVVKRGRVVVQDGRLVQRGSPSDA